MKGRQDFLDRVEDGMSALRGELSKVEAMLRRPLPPGFREVSKFL